VNHRDLHIISPFMAQGMNQLTILLFFMLAYAILLAVGIYFSWQKESALLRAKVAELEETIEKADLLERLRQ
jgi:hypothetical protein